MEQAERWNINACSHCPLGKLVSHTRVMTSSLGLDSKDDEKHCRENLSFQGIMSVKFYLIGINLF